MDEFLNKLKGGSFTSIKQKEIRLQQQLYSHSILTHFKEIHKELKEKTNIFHEKQNNIYKRKNSKALEEIFSDHSIKDFSSICDISIDHSFSELSPGYSTPNSEPEEFLNHTYNMKKQNELNLTLQENRLIEAKKTTLETQKVKKIENESIQNQKTSVPNKSSNQTSTIKVIF